MLKPSCKKQEVAIKYSKKKAKNNNKPQKAAGGRQREAAPALGCPEWDVLFRRPAG